MGDFFRFCIAYVEIARVSVVDVECEIKCIVRIGIVALKKYEDGYARGLDFV